MSPSGLIIRCCLFSFIFLILFSFPTTIFGAGCDKSTATREDPAINCKPACGGGPGSNYQGDVVYHYAASPDEPDPTCTNVLYFSDDQCRNPGSNQCPAGCSNDAECGGWACAGNVSATDYCNNGDTGTGTKFCQGFNCGYDCDPPSTCRRLTRGQGLGGFSDQFSCTNFCKTGYTCINNSCQGGIFGATYGSFQECRDSGCGAQGSRCDSNTWTCVSDPNPASTCDPAACQPPPQSPQCEGVNVCGSYLEPCPTDPSKQRACHFVSFNGGACAWNAGPNCNGSCGGCFGGGISCPAGQSNPHSTCVSGTCQQVNACGVSDCSGCGGTAPPPPNPIGQCKDTCIAGCGGNDNCINQCVLDCEGNPGGSPRPPACTQPKPKIIGYPGDGSVLVSPNVQPSGEPWDWSQISWTSPEPVARQVRVGAGGCAVAAPKVKTAKPESAIPQPRS